MRSTLNVSPAAAPRFSAWEPACNLLRWLRAITPIGLYRNRSKKRRRISHWSLAALPDDPKLEPERKLETMTGLLCRQGWCQSSLIELEQAGLRFDIDIPRLRMMLRSEQGGSSTVVLGDKALTANPDLYVGGLVDASLKLAQAYLDEPPLYLTPTIKLERADGHLTGSRHWHRDVEDFGMLRLLIYLNDVGKDDGPLQLIGLAASEHIAQGLHYHSGYLPDALFAPYLTQAIVCTGPTGTVVLFDGTRLFHRASPPVVEDRYSVTYSFSSRRPLRLRPAARPRRKLHTLALTMLPKALAACLPAPMFW